MSAKNILLTGGTGFVGANLARRLLQEGHTLHLLVRREYKDWRVKDLLPHLQIHVVDMLDSRLLNAEVAAIRPEWVFHLATYGAYSWQEDLHQAVQTNFLGTVNVVEACRKAGFEVFVNTGSSSEYGFKDHAPAENEWIDPNSYYAVTKASATLFCRYIAKRYNLCIRTLRLYSVYGPYEEPDRLIPKVILHGLKGQLPPLVNPDIVRDFVYVQDVENAYLLLASHSSGGVGAVYNLGTGIQTSLRDVVILAQQVFSLSAEPQWGTMPNRQWDTNVWQANNTSLRKIGWEPDYTFEKGFRETVAWFQTHPELLPHYLSS